MKNKARIKWTFWIGFLVICGGLGLWFGWKTAIIIFAIFVGSIHVMAAVANIKEKK